MCACTHAYIHKSIQKYLHTYIHISLLCAHFKNASSCCWFHRGSMTGDQHGEVKAFEWFLHLIAELEHIHHHQRSMANTEQAQRDWVKFYCEIHMFVTRAPREPIAEGKWRVRASLLACLLASLLACLTGNAYGHSPRA